MHKKYLVSYSTPGTPVTFLDQQFGNEPVSLAGPLTEKAKEFHEVISGTNLGTTHQRYLLFSKLILPQMVEGPMVDACDDAKHEYLKLDH